MSNSLILKMLFVMMFTFFWVQLLGIARTAYLEVAKIDRFFEYTDGTPQAAFDWYKKWEPILMLSKSEWKMTLNTVREDTPYCKCSWEGCDYEHKMQTQRRPTYWYERKVKWYWENYWQYDLNIPDKYIECRMCWVITVVIDWVSRSDNYCTDLFSVNN